MTSDEKPADAIEIPKVLTFFDDETETEMELLSVSESGLCKCLYRSQTELSETRVARHRDRVRPINDAARKMLAITDEPS